MKNPKPQGRDCAFDEFCKGQNGDIIMVFKKAINKNVMKPVASQLVQNVA